MTKAEYNLLREYRKLSAEGKREVFEYVRWVRDEEAQERLRNTAEDPAKFQSVGVF